MWTVNDNTTFRARCEAHMIAACPVVLPTYRVWGETDRHGKSVECLVDDALICRISNMLEFVSWVITQFH